MRIELYEGNTYTKVVVDGSEYSISRKDGSDICKYITNIIAKSDHIICVVPHNGFNEYMVTVDKKMVKVFVASDSEVDVHYIINMARSIKCSLDFKQQLEDSDWS